MVFCELEDDPVIRGELSGLRELSERETNTRLARVIRAVTSTKATVQMAERQGRVSRRRSAQHTIDVVKEAHEFFADGHGTCWQENAVTEVRRLRERVKELEDCLSQRHLSTQSSKQSCESHETNNTSNEDKRIKLYREQVVCIVSFNNLIDGPLQNACRAFCGLPRSGLQALIEAMEVLEMDKVWSNVTEKGRKDSPP